MTLLKSDYWEKEDERRLVCMEVDRPIYIPVNNALKTVYLGVSANRNKDFINSIYDTFNGRFNLSLLIYENNHFERWGIKTLSNGQIGTCNFVDIND